MSWALQLVLAIAIFVGGMAAGIKYHVGVVAQRDLAAARLVESDKIQQRKFSDVASGKHAGALSKLSNQLGAAREKIASLSGRECLDFSTAGVLNAIGEQPGGAAAGQPAGAPKDAPAVGDLRYSTDRDVASFIAACRSQYGEVSSQLNQILDIEDRRHPPAPP